MKKEVYIIGGGPSLLDFNFDLLKDKDTIAVNKSILDVPNPKYFITVDYTFLKKIEIQKLKDVNTTKIFIVCLHFDFIKEENGQIIDIKHNIIYNLQDFDVIIKSRVEGGIGFNLRDFRNGLNSGYCALQLAVALGYEKIYLLGLDLCNNQKYTTNKQTHYHGGYGEKAFSFDIKLEKYYQHFVKGLKEIKQNSNINVISLSPVSRLNSQIDYVNYKDVLCQEKKR